MPLAIKTDLLDIRGKLLIKKDTVINDELIRQLTERGKKLPRRLVKIKDTALIRDFRKIFNEEKYFTVFTPYSENERIMRIAEDTELIEEVAMELIGMKDFLPYTYRHMLCVTAVTVKLAMDMKADGYDPHTACAAGFVHDIGKTRVPKRILGKADPLTQSEYDILQSHSILGYLLLCYYYGESGNDILDAARDHHEKLDGSGYPRGTAKKNKYSQLIAPPDIFDALISVRPYRRAVFTIRQALDLLIGEANDGKISKKVVYHLISYVRKEHPDPEKLTLYPSGSIFSPPDSNYGKIIPD